MGQRFFLKKIFAAFKGAFCACAVICLFLVAGGRSASAALTVTLSNDLITFNLAAGQAGPVNAPAPVRAMISSTTPWTLTYQATPLLDGAGKSIAPDRIFIRTPYTNSFESLSIPRLAGKGGPTGKEADEIFVSFRFMPTGQEQPGVYEGTVFSVEGGPPVHVRIVVEKKTGLITGLLEPVVKNLEIALLSMAITPQNVHFSVTGEPKEYDGDNTITLTVSYLSVGNGFVVKAKATPLTGLQGSIPAERIFVSADQGGYESLEKEVTVLQVGPLIQLNTAKAALRYRLQTTWDDAAGDYTGQIVFTCAPAL
ncbi:MAG: hypothetical protein WC291_06995 [Thermodesulfovibrionales bacterium]|jgi:hypothetical protein